MPEENVLQDTLTPDEGESLESLATPEAVDESKSQELILKNKKLFERAKKAEEEKRLLKEKLAALDKPSADPSPDTKPDEIETVLGLRSEGYSDAEVLTLRKYAKRMNLDIKEVLKDPFIKSGIEAERAKAKVEQATPAPTNRTLTFGDKSFKDMTQEEKKANWSKIFEERKNENI